MLGNDVEFRELGTVGVVTSTGVVTIGSRQVRAVLAALLVERGGVVSSDRLAEIIWPDDPPVNSHERVAKLVHLLRDALPAEAVDAVRTVPPGYALEHEGRCDATRCERLLAEARAHVASSERLDALARFDEAMELWRGPAFSEFADDDFARPEVARLAEVRVAVQEERADVMLALGRHQELVGELETLVAEHPFRERLWGQLMLALYRSGRQADALRAYGRVRGMLVEELGIEPGSALTELEGQILRHDPRLDATGVESDPVRAAPHVTHRRRRWRAALAAGAVALAAVVTVLLLTASDTDEHVVGRHRITVPYAGTLTESIEGNSGGSTFAGRVTGPLIGHGTYTGLSKTAEIPPACGDGRGVATTTSTVFTTANGDTLLQDEEGMLCSSGLLSFEFSGTFTISGGSGCFLGATGHGQVAAKIVYVGGFVNGTSTSRNVGSIRVLNTPHCPQTRRAS